MCLAEVGYALRIGATAVQVYQQQCFSTRRKGLLQQTFVQLERVGTGIYANRVQTIAGQCQHGSYEGVPRHQHIVALTHHTKLLVGIEDEPQSIVSIACTDAERRADIGSILLFKRCHSTSAKVPAAVYHRRDSRLYLVAVHRRDTRKGKIGNGHRVYSYVSYTTVLPP